MVSRASTKKEARRLLQKHHTADGHHHQAVSEDRTGNEVTVRSHLRHGHHGHGARRSEEHDENKRVGTTRKSGSWQRPHTRFWAWRGLIVCLQKQGTAIGAANAATLTVQLEAARRHEHGPWNATMRGSAGSIGRTSPSKLGACG